MKHVYAIFGSIVSPIGLTAEDTFASAMEGRTGLKKTDLDYLSDQMYCSTFSPEQWAEIAEPSAKYGIEYPFEQLLIKPILDVIEKSGINPSDAGVVLVIATTKGNIDMLGVHPDSQLLLHHSANKVAKAIGCVNPPVVISNACISGLSAIIHARRLLQSGYYNTAIVAGADVLGKFIISGFQSLMAMSPEPCRPFDKNRQGINLGEGSAAMILQTEVSSESNGIELLGGCITNDANHVSAPSRTGQELAYAILQSLSESKLGAEDLQFVSAHGTATSYNDEMEAKALNLAGIAHLPTHSLKGYFGHTLGAAGLIETIICFQSLFNNTFIPSLGFEETGTTEPVNICTSKIDKPMKAAVKTMAGFGGCNAALVFSKIH